jgi:ATP-dependent DNA ligase
VINGEAVVLDADGRSSFAQLEVALDKHGAAKAVLYGCDLLFPDGKDLRAESLEERRAAFGDFDRPKAAASPQRQQILVNFIQIFCYCL